MSPVLVVVQLCGPGPVPCPGRPGPRQLRHMAGASPGMEIYELQSLSRDGSTSKLAPDWLHTSKQPIRIQDRKLTQLLTWLQVINFHSSRPPPCSVSAQPPRRACAAWRGCVCSPSTGRAGLPALRSSSIQRYSFAITYHFMYLFCYSACMRFCCLSFSIFVSLYLSLS